MSEASKTVRNMMSSVVYSTSAMIVFDVATISKQNKNFRVCKTMNF